MFNSNDPQALYQEAMADEAYTKSPEYISNKLFRNQHLLERMGVMFKGDYLDRKLQCDKLAGELLDYPQHKLWEKLNQL